jgi:hypothetical protein
MVIVNTHLDVQERTTFSAALPISNDIIRTPTRPLRRNSTSFVITQNATEPLYPSAEGSLSRPPMGVCDYHKEALDLLMTKQRMIKRNGLQQKQLGSRSWYSN